MLQHRINTFKCNAVGSNHSQQFFVGSHRRSVERQGYRNMKKPAESTDKLIPHIRQPSSVAASVLAAAFVSAVAFVAGPSL